MSASVQDELWPHFVPLWKDLRVIAPKLLLAGGYGLFLKQQWLISQVRIPGAPDGDAISSEERQKLVANNVNSLVSIHRWIDQTPRVTKDFDFIASLDLIASPEEQHQLHAVLEKHDFKVVPANARWQFAKVIDEVGQVVLDFHSPTPANKREDLRVQARRVKPQPSLGQMGIQVVKTRKRPVRNCIRLHSNSRKRKLFFPIR